LAVVACVASACTSSHAVVTRPAGAYVIVDGRLAGRTPLTFSGGSRLVLFLPGYEAQTLELSSSFPREIVFVPRTPDATQAALGRVSPALREQSSTYLVRALDAAAANDCATVNGLAEAIRKLDPELHRVVVRRELSLAPCFRAEHTDVHR